LSSFALKVKIFNLNAAEQCIRVETLTPDIYKVKYTQLIGGDAFFFCYCYCTV